jgi:Condensin complex subunit 2
MSKTFDEGGAKGLLLVNLGVGPKGCNIVFDSKEEDAEEQKYSEAEYTEGMVDITSLTAKLDLLIGTEVLENIELVPQLRTLRQEYAILEKEGFITHEEKKVGFSFKCAFTTPKTHDRSTQYLFFISPVSSIRHIHRRRERGRNVNSSRLFGA